MSLTEQLAQILDTEDDRKKNDSNFSKAVETIESLKRIGILERTRYKLPLADTVGRYVPGGHLHTDAEHEGAASSKTQTLFSRR